MTSTHSKLIGSSALHVVEKPNPANPIAKKGAAESEMKILCGAAAIARFLFRDEKKRRKIYYLNSKGRLPIFRLHAELCAEEDMLVRYLRQQANKCMKDGDLDE